MELWYTDEHTGDVRFSMKATVQIASKKSAVQQIDILDTKAYGRVLVLDGGLMITEKDEFIYHEMLAHVPMAVHPRVRNVLVIGGGDGGTVRELVKYREIESIDLVEADKDVVLLSKKFLLPLRKLPLLSRKLPLPQKKLRSRKNLLKRNLPRKSPPKKNLLSSPVP